MPGARWTAGHRHCHALAGTLVLLGSLALAWPSPVLLLSVCLVDGGVLTALAFLYRRPLVHAALPCLVLGLLFLGSWEQER